MAALAPLALHEVRLVPGRSLALLLENTNLLAWAQAQDNRSATRALVRTLVSQLTGRPPQSLQFDKSAHGKPYLQGVDSIGFNVSHSRQYTLVALSAAGEIGCDVEDRFVAADVKALGTLVLHETELQAMQHLSEPQQLQSLMRYWVRKEAALKAIGSGFLEDPRLLVVGLDDEFATWWTRPGPGVALHNAPPDVGCLAAVAGPDAACDWYSLEPPTQQ